MATPDFGLDLDTAFIGPDGEASISPMFDLTSGRTLLAQAIANRLSTPRGQLPDDPAYGYDLRDALNDSLTATGLFALQSAIVSECKKDERIAGATCRCTFDAVAKKLTVLVRLATADGPFLLTLAVSDLSVLILSVA
jgi:phage baseplate assembly protein W